MSENAAVEGVEGRVPAIEVRAWDKPWKGAFLVALARQPNVTAACRLAGISREGAYNEGRLDKAFKLAWLEARAVGVEFLEQVALQRATVGREVRVVRRRTRTDADGKVLEREETIEERVETSDALLITLLKAYKPEVYRERFDVRHTGEDDEEDGPVAPSGPRKRSRERREELIRIAREMGLDHPDVEGHLSTDGAGDTE